MGFKKHRFAISTAHFPSSSIKEIDFDLVSKSGTMVLFDSPEFTELLRQMSDSGKIQTMMLVVQDGKRTRTVKLVNLEATGVGFSYSTKAPKTEPALVEISFTATEIDITND